MVTVCKVASPTKGVCGVRRLLFSIYLEGIGRFFNACATSPFDFEVLGSIPCLHGLGHGVQQAFSFDLGLDTLITLHRDIFHFVSQLAGWNEVMQVLLLVF